jgi:hypothetical protein
MYTIIEEIMIFQKPDVVFRFISDYSNDIKWRNGVVEMKQSTNGFTEKGTVTREKIKLLGQKWSNVAKIIEYQENKKVSFRVIKGIEGVSGFRSVYEISKNCTGFIYALKINPQGIFKFITPFIQNTFRKRVRKDLQKLKHILEQKHALAA